MISFTFSVCISHQCTKFRDWRGGGGVEPRPRGQYPAEMSRGGWRVCTVYSVLCCTVQYSVAGWQYSLHPNQLSRHLRPQVAISASALYVRCPAPHTIQRLEILHQIYLGKNQKTSGRPKEDEEDLQRLFLGCIMLYAGQSRNDIMLC